MPTEIVNSITSFDKLIVTIVDVTHISETDATHVFCLFGIGIKWLL